MAEPVFISYIPKIKLSLNCLRLASGLNPVIQLKQRKESEADFTLVGYTEVK